MITSKLTSKSQTTIPQSVRKALKLSEGDVLTYEISGGKVIIGKAERGERDDPFATFTEWDSDADRRAYGKL